MRQSLKWLHLYMLLCVPAPISATDDPDYNPSLNFRPNNITGLTGLYAWVGSYYNATTEVELKPIIGSEVGVDVCPSLQNYTSTTKYDSILSITQRGGYNSGKDSVNVWLSLIPPGYNVSSVPWEREIWQSSPLLWPISTSEPTWKVDENSTTYDFINFTTTRSHGSSYNLSATVKNRNGDATRTLNNITMPACNATNENGDFSVGMYTDAWWSTEGWKAFKLPEMSVQFDKKTANLTVDGYFSAYPYVRTNVSGWIGPHQISIGDSVQGTIKIRFSGILDSYHSDSLDVSSADPVWLRTVGFGNDSSNIGYESTADRPFAGSTMAITAAVLLFSALTIYL